MLRLRLSTLKRVVRGTEKLAEMLKSNSMDFKLPETQALETVPEIVIENAIDDGNGKASHDVILRHSSSRADFHQNKNQSAAAYGTMDCQSLPSSSSYSNVWKRRLLYSLPHHTSLLSCVVSVLWKFRTAVKTTRDVIATGKIYRLQIYLTPRSLLFPRLDDRFSAFFFF